MSATKSELQPRITTFDEAEEIRPFGTPARIMLRTEETGGAFSALLVMHGPGEGPPPHSHAGQAEYFFVVDGTYEMTVGGETRIIGPGTMVFAPPKTVHTFKNIGDATAKMLDWSLPGGQAPQIWAQDSIVWVWPWTCGTRWMSCQAHQNPAHRL